MRLKRSFFTQPALKVAKEMLGKFLVHEVNGKKIGGMIVETEAYIGTKDRASHAFGGKMTERNKAEYLVGGHIYIYLVYGMHWQLNISTSKDGEPECVLIRALEPELKSKDKSGKTKTNGPGKLCRFLKLDKSFYGYDLCRKNSIFYLEDRGMPVKAKDIIAGPRVGIDYAGSYWSKVPWRFYIKGNKFVSKPNLC